MGICAVITQAFGSYAVGQVVESPDEVEAILSGPSHRNAVRTVMPDAPDEPAPAPAPAARSTSKSAAPSTDSDERA